MLATPLAFNTTLTRRWEKDSVIIPLAEDDVLRLKNWLGDGGYTFLTVRDTVTAEIVKVTFTCEDLLVERGVDGTEPKPFPRGSCIRFELTPAVVKDMICNYDCCEDGCVCNPVKIEGLLLPQGKVGVPYQGSVVCSGDLPINISVDGMPSWMTASIGANFITFTGTPTGAGQFNISVAATNCSGAGISAKGGVLTITT